MKDDVAVAWKPPIVFACRFFVFMPLMKGFYIDTFVDLPPAASWLTEAVDVLSLSIMPLFELAARFFCD